MSTLTRRNSGAPFLDLFDWLETPLTVLRPLGSTPLRVEDYVRDGSYVVRAEIPGVDPEKDVAVTLSKGVLTIKADKHQATEGKHHSEFHYGSFARSIALPAAVDEKHIQAFYGNGVLEVTVALKEKEEDKAERHIPVMRNKHIDPS
jgi:HSP20 family protein